MLHGTGDREVRSQRARLALEGLSVGDAFGQRFFVRAAVFEQLVRARAVPASPWGWTDDTAMAISVVEVLEAHGAIDADALAGAFARRYAVDPARGYGGTAHDILQRIGAGEPWHQVAGSAFDGQGSCGNGSAMRVAPVGGWFADDLPSVVRHAAMSAAPTHAHPEGQAGAIAIAVAAAVAWQMGQGLRLRDPEAIFEEALRWTPAGPTHSGIEAVSVWPLDGDVQEVAAKVGNGSQVLCQDTVPLSLWCAARHLFDYESAMWTTVSAGGDRDTTCSIVGGIVALSVGLAGIPDAWRKAREPLPRTVSG